MSPRDKMFARDDISRLSDEIRRILGKLGLRELPVTHGGLACPTEETAKIVRNAMQESTIITAANELGYEPALVHSEWGHAEHWFVNFWLRSG